ncbi:MAG TPA: alpha/beta fold hydrolase [Acidimicrobiales bacterium]|nr:alpha/beta fold hydrolase [Acidimicrobiales bacterium]
MFTVRSPHIHRLAIAPLAALAIAVGVTSCSSNPTQKASPTIASSVAWSSPGPSTVGSFYDPPADMKPAPQGTLIREQVVTGVPGVPSEAKLWRVLYHSRTIAGADIAVSGYVVIPTSAAPSGGRPIITWAHGTTGVARICAPSLFSNASDASGIYLAPDLTQYIQSGYIVAATDYQGLGGPTVHPYLVGQSEGQNVLDAALAAGHLPGASASNKVIIVGHSQGGHSALFAGQLAPQYTPSLNVLGTVAIAPLTEVATALPLALQMGANESALLVSAAYAWSNTYSDLPMNSIFDSSAIPTIDKLETTTCENQVSKGLAKLPPNKILLTSFASNSALVKHLAENSPGSVHTQSPILILQGAADTTIPDILAEMFEKNQCPAVNDNMALRLYPGATHGTVLKASSSDMLSWISDRFAGTPAATGCSAITVTP